MEKDKFGIWTGELIVVSIPNIRTEILEQYDMRLIDENGPTGYFQAGVDFDLQRDLEILRKHKGVEEIKLDIKMGYLKRM